MIIKDVHIEITATPEELAKEFCALDDTGQAAFFNEIHRITQKWKYQLCFQLQYVTDNPTLTAGGRSVMTAIGEYAQPSPNAKPIGARRA